MSVPQTSPPFDALHPAAAPAHTPAAGVPRHPPLRTPAGGAIAAGDGAAPSLPARLGTTLFVASGWVTFALWWVVVLREEPPRYFREVLGILGGALLTIMAGTRVWVAHNRRLARRGTRGRASRFVAHRWTHDALGRALVVDGDDTLKSARELRVERGGDEKRYVAAAPCHRGWP